LAKSHHCFTLVWQKESTAKKKKEKTHIKINQGKTNRKRACLNFHLLMAVAR